MPLGPVAGRALGREGGHGEARSRLRESPQPGEGRRHPRLRAPSARSEREFVQAANEQIAAPGIAGTAGAEAVGGFVAPAGTAGLVGKIALPETLAQTLAGLDVGKAAQHRADAATMEGCSPDPKPACTNRRESQSSNTVLREVVRPRR